MKKNINSRYIPFHLLVEATDNCNFYCLHCYISFNNKTNKVTDYNQKSNNLVNLVKKVYNECKQLKFISLTGGEPLLKYDFDYLWKSLWKLKNTKLSLFSNLSLLNDNLINLFLSYPPFSVVTSLYSYNSRTFENISNLSDFDYSNIYKNIIKLKSYNISTTARIPILKQNYYELDDIENFCIKNKINYGWVWIYIPPINQKYHIEDILIEKEKMFNILIRKVYNKNNINLNEIKNEIIKKNTIINYKKNCAINYQIIIDSYENIKNCLINNNKIKVDETNINNILKILEKQARNFNKILDESCKNCKALYICKICKVKIKLYKENNFNYRDYYCWIYRKLFEYLFGGFFAKKEDKIC